MESHAVGRVQVMALTLRPTGLAPPVYEHLNDYEVLDDGQSIGRIYESPAATRPEMAWFWSLTIIGAHQTGVATHGYAPSLEAAKAQFLASYDTWLTWTDRRTQG